MQKPLYLIFNDKTSLARHFADRLVKLTSDMETVYVAVSGGSTPQHIFDVMATEYQASIHWEKIKLFWVDERCVPPTHGDSNYGMTKKHLLDKVAIPANNVFRVMGELQPNEALYHYIDCINQQVPIVNGIPQFDLTILGMGDDGHTASIFPHEISLWQSPNICELGHHPQSGQNRVTLTGTVINHSKHIVFLVTGQNKATKVSEIFTQSPQAANYPASLVDATKTTCLLDADAAGLID
jgi:6-phosphogluconolactonase